MPRKTNKRLLWGIAIAVILALAVGIAIFVFGGSASNQVSKKLSLEQAQTFIDNAFDSIPKSTASGAKKILESTSITVDSLDYGYEKDIVLQCTYTSLDVRSAVLNDLDSIMSDVYGFCMENEAEGKKTNATKINLKVTDDIVSCLNDADTVSGQVTMYIYETQQGLQLYLDDLMVDTCTGGLISVRNAIKDITTVTYQGQQVDIANMNTLRNGVTDCFGLENYTTQKPDTSNSLQKSWNDFCSDFHRNFIEKDRWTYLASGLGTTLALTALAALMGVLLGFIVAIVRCTNQMTGKLKLVDLFCRFYLTVIRGTPVMVQLLILFFVFLLPLNVDKFTAAVLCFGLNSGAYVAEIVRGGITSVDKGQIEAGRSLGFNYVQTMVHFVIPQAFKAILPSLANEFITLLKESSVAFYIGVADLTQGGLKIRSTTFSTFMPLIAVALIYLALVMILTKLVSLLERRLAKSDH